MPQLELGNIEASQVSSQSMWLNNLFFSTEIREEELEVVTPIVEELGKLSVSSI